MAKSKNHTAHNQTYKQHKNGIRKPRKFRQSSKKGVRQTAACTRVLLLKLARADLVRCPQMDPKFLRNQVWISACVCVKLYV